MRSIPVAVLMVCLLVGATMASYFDHRHNSRPEYAGGHQGVEKHHELDDRTYHFRRPPPSQNTLDSFPVRRITDHELLQEAQYGPFVYAVLVYTDNTHSRTMLSAWYKIADKLKGEIRFAQVDAAGTRFEQLLAGKIAEGPLPALYVYDDVGGHLSSAKIVTTLWTDEADWTAKLREHAENLGTQIVAGVGRLKHGATYQEEQPTDEL